MFLFHLCFANISFHYLFISALYFFLSFFPSNFHPFYLYFFSFIFFSFFLSFFHFIFKGSPSSLDIVLCCLICASLLSSFLSLFYVLFFSPPSIIINLVFFHLLLSCLPSFLSSFFPSPLFFLIHSFYYRSQFFCS